MPAPRLVDHPIHYAFAQAFGECSIRAPDSVPVDDTDMISAVAFSRDSKYVATGDRGGRIVILKRAPPRRQMTQAAFVAATAATQAAYAQARAFRRYQRRHRHRSQYRRQPNSDDDEDEDDDEDDNDRDSWGGSRGRRPRGHGLDGDFEIRVEPPPEFCFWTQFQSHDSEFDYLKSMEIEEKVNQICWCREAANSQRLIATNDKTIKVWRVVERDVKAIASFNVRPKSPREGLSRPYVPPSPRRPNPQFMQSSGMTMSNGERNVSTVTPSITGKGHAAALQVPRLETCGRVVVATPRRVFSGAHTYHINSLSLNSDEETFLSADDLRVHVWNLEMGGKDCNILDLKPDSMENLIEVITAARFHPSHCNLFMYACSRGPVKLCDLRASSLCRSSCRKFEHNDAHPPGQPSFFTEVIASTSDARFSPDGRYILTRDFMHLRLWDMHMERAPLRVIPVHDHLRLRLCDLYENDCIFDKFQCAFSADGGSLITGSYNSMLQAYSARTGLGAAVEASVGYLSGNSTRYNPVRGPNGNMIGSGPVELFDPTRRIMTIDSARTENIVAVASGTALYTYYAPGR